MKKMLVILMVSVFAMASAGIPLHKHFCNGHLVDTSLTEKPSCCGVPDNKDDCCSNESTIFSIQDSDFITQKLNIDIPTPIWDLQIAPLYYLVFAPKLTAYKTAFNIWSNAPPQLKRYLTFCQLIFYN